MVTTGISNVIELLSGVALFLFGMTLMGEGLKKVAGSKMEMVLYKLSGNAIKGILLGTGVTSIIQSSSATSVMCVGFVNSGMMKVRQAIGVIMGAIIGTSVTGWIICLSALEGGSGWVSLFSTSTLTGIVAVIGVILRMFSKKQLHNHVGDILMGFAILMFGMSAMSGAVSPLRESEFFLELLTKFSNPILGILVGTRFRRHRYPPGSGLHRRHHLRRGLPPGHGYRHRRIHARSALLPGCQRQRQAGRLRLPLH